MRVTVADGYFLIKWRAVEAPNTPAPTTRNKELVLDISKCFLTASIENLITVQRSRGTEVIRNKQNILVVLQAVDGVEHNVRFETNKRRESMYGRDAGADLWPAWNRFAIETTA